MEQYVIYLRKSRADADAEKRGEGETLARHEKALLELSKRMHLNITDIYREIVSGETIAARPVMQKLLAEVEQDIWTGVLVMEVERLARGDTIDQGLVAQTFKFSNTKIITPMKTYDPANEFDEEYFEFGLFMSRREYKTINRRLQRGRLASIKEGKYVANQAPYGYRRERLEHDKGFRLVPDPPRSDYIKMIFDWYTVGLLQSDGTYRRLGISLIVRSLNDMGIKPVKNDVWTQPTIRDILTNPVYIGKLRWNWRPAVKKMVDGQVITTRPHDNNCTLSDGLHEPLIAKETFEKAQEYIKSNRPNPVARDRAIKNPLSGIVICGKCGRRMSRRPYQDSKKPDTLMCPVTSCPNVSVALHFAEEKILDALRQWLDDYKLTWNLNSETPNLRASIKIREEALKAADSELVKLQKQLESVHTFLEQGVYDIDTFLERTRLISSAIEKAKEKQAAIQEELQLEITREENRKNIIPKVEHLLEAYWELPSPKAKNDILKEVLEKVVYVKENKGRWHSDPQDFEITLYPRLPQNENHH